VFRRRYLVLAAWLVMSLVITECCCTYVLHHDVRFTRKVVVRAGVVGRLLSGRATGLASRASIVHCERFSDLDIYQRCVPDRLLSFNALPVTCQVGNGLCLYSCH
jgi:hypothetical protein